MLWSGLCERPHVGGGPRPRVAAGLFDGEGRFGQFDEVGRSVPAGQVIAGRAVGADPAFPAESCHARAGGRAAFAEEDPRQHRVGPGQLG